jgi:hypothetical protein
MNGRRLGRLLALTTLAVAAGGGLVSADPAPPRTLAAAAWLEGEGASRSVVVALALRPPAGATVVHVGFGALPDAPEDPGGYGTIPPDSWREVRLAAGEVVLARRAIGAAREPSVLVARQPASAPIDVHHLIDEGGGRGGLLFARPREGGPVTLSTHLAHAGDVVTMDVSAPSEDGFFRPETFEILRVARRLGLVGDPEDAGPGAVPVEWVRPEGDPPATLLEGPAGEAEIRSHFDDPRCAWAGRHVGWMPDHWILAYLRPASLRFRLRTDGVRVAGVVADTWRGWGALAVESIWPNGFGGSSANLDLPPLLVVPKDTPLREVRLP